MENNIAKPMTERNTLDSGKAEHDALLVEYQAAQDSAQHHDNLSNTVSSLMWGASLILLGFVLEKLTDPILRPIITAVSVLGIILNVTVWIFALQFNSVKRQKYARCKELEERLNLSQHRNLRYASKSQRVFYAIVMLSFIFIWILVIWTMWK